MSLEIYSEVEVTLWIRHDPTNSVFFSPRPRFQRFGYYQDGALIRQWKSPTGQPNRLPTQVRQHTFWTAHHVSFNNILNEDKEWFFNCLEKPPIITESIPSFVSGLTDLGSLTVTLVDPDVRSFFDHDLTEASTQNPVTVYRVLCDEKTPVWRGYIEGVSFTSDRKVTVSLRPLTKRFDQTADFGFNAYIRRWQDNEYKIPIVAARVIPWTVQAQDHSAIGAEPWSQLLREGLEANRDLYGWGLRDVSNSENAYFLHDYSARALGAGVANEHLKAIRETLEEVRKQASNNSNPNQELDRYRVSFLEGCTTVLEARINNFDKHLEFKRPTYVSFVPSELVPTQMLMKPTGEMKFERGIFFHESESEDASSFFEPNSTNYQLAPVPMGANTNENLNPASSCHLEKFILGVEDFGQGDITKERVKIDSFPIGDSDINPFIAKVASYLRTATVQAISGAELLTGHDATAIFPSLSLGDSYCDWTHVPTLVQDLRRNANRQGYLPYPPRDQFIQPIIKYMQLNPTTGLYEETMKRAHPLDSFYRWTLSSNKSSATESVYFRALTVTPHATKLCYIDPLSGAKPTVLNPTDSDQSIFNVINYSLILGSNATTPLRPSGGAGNVDFPATIPGLTLRSTDYIFTQWATFTIIKGGTTGKLSHQKELSRFMKWGDLGTGKAYYISPNTTEPLANQTWLSNGRNPVGMARSKDMYVTTADIDRFAKPLSPGASGIQKGPTDADISEYQADFSHRGGAAQNLRVMPAFPKSSLMRHHFPIVTTDRSISSPSSYYVSVEYGVLDEAGYWDTSVLLNPDAVKNAQKGRYFKGYYHHDQSGVRQGVKPVTFIKSVTNAVGFETDFDHKNVGGEAALPQELGFANSMQLIGDTSNTYLQLINRLVPGLGKFLRFNPLTNKVEIVDWAVSHKDRAREIVATFDEECMVFISSNHSPSSRTTSIIFENQDMVRGTNTLEEFSDDDFAIGKYTSYRSTPFIQGKTISINTGTWWQTPQIGIYWYEFLSDILTNRVDIYSFSVPTEILITFGPLGTIKVGSWVRIINGSLSNGVADVFIIEAQATELTTNFRAYHFGGVGIQSEGDIPDEGSTPTLNLFTKTDIIEENSTAQWVVSSSVKPSESLRMNLSISLNNVGSDSLAGLKTFDMQAGKNTASFLFPVKEIADRNLDGTITATLSARSGYELGEFISRTISIARLSDPVVEEPESLLVLSSLTGNASQITEGSDIVWTISTVEGTTRDEDTTINLNLSLTGNFFSTSQGRKTVVLPADSSQVQYRLSTIGDTTDEPDGSAALNILPGDGYRLVAPNVYRVAVRVLDDDETVTGPMISLSSRYRQVDEGDTIEWTLSLRRRATTAITVNLNLALTGNFFSTQAGNKQVTIRRRSRSATYSLRTVDDTADETNGSATLSVLSGTGYSIPQGGLSNTVSVRDDDYAYPDLFKVFDSGLTLYQSLTYRSANSSYYIHWNTQDVNSAPRSVVQWSSTGREGTTIDLGVDTQVPQFVKIRTDGNGFAVIERRPRPSQTNFADYQRMRYVRFNGLPLSEGLEDFNFSLDSTRRDISGLAVTSSRYYVLVGARTSRSRKTRNYTVIPYTESGVPGTYVEISNTSGTLRGLVYIDSTTLVSVHVDSSDNPTSIRTFVRGVENTSKRITFPSGLPEIRDIILNSAGTHYVCLFSENSYSARLLSIKKV